MTTRNFEAERELARQEAERLLPLLHAHGYEVDEIDWERAGLLAYVIISGMNVGDLITLGGARERGHLLDDVRFKLLEATAQRLLQYNASAISWMPLELPPDAPAEIVSVWRVHIGEDERPGVNIAEVMRNGTRHYEYFAGGPTPGIHSFHVDTISVQAMQLIHRAGGNVIYQPNAQRADSVQGRRYVMLPEGTRQISEGEEPMAPQRFVLPGGAHLRLLPEWYTVALDVAEVR